MRSLSMARPCHPARSHASGAAMRGFLFLLALIAAPAAAQVPPPVAQAVVQPLPGVTPDGRYFGHIPYAEVPNEQRAAMAESVAPNKTCELQLDAAAALYRLTDAARAAGIQLRLISCYRSVAHQQALFCGAGAFGPCRDPAERSRSVAPGGYSEHVTGYAIDFGAPSPPGCRDLDPCMASTLGGQWLTANATKFGWELSFPNGNRQGVTWEPWHWRWVGSTAAEPGAAAARAIFARARASYPASPGIADPVKPPAVKLPPVDPARFTGPRS